MCRPAGPKRLLHGSQWEKKLENQRVAEQQTLHWDHGKSLQQKDAKSIFNLTMEIHLKRYFEIPLPYIHT